MTGPNLTLIPCNLSIVLHSVRNFQKMLCALVLRITHLEPYLTHYYGLNVVKCYGTENKLFFIVWT